MVVMKFIIMKTWDDEMNEDENDSGCIDYESLEDLKSWCKKYSQYYPNKDGFKDQNGDYTEPILCPIKGLAIISKTKWECLEWFVVGGISASMAEEFDLFDINRFKERWFQNNSCDCLVSVGYSNLLPCICYLYSHNTNRWDFDRSAILPFCGELEESRWNPRSVLGRLEFDRRLVEDDIVFD